jgi:hypothetical protein
MDRALRAACSSKGIKHKEKMMQKILTLMLLSTLLIACGQSVGSGQPRPDSTDAVLAHQAHCNDVWQRRFEQIQYELHECFENPPPEGCPDPDDVEAPHKANWYTCLDSIPMVPLDCLLQLDHESHTQDTDGDGLTDFEESQMYLNPCEPCSYGGVEGVDCDADLDFDQDGIPNGEDEDPDCTPYHREMLHCDPLP